MTILSFIPFLAAQDGWVWGVFSSLRAAAASGASQSVGLAFAIGCIIMALKMVRIAYDLMSDEQSGGLGNIRLSQIVGPLIILFAIQASGTILSVFDGVVSDVTGGISRSYSSASVSMMFTKAVEITRKEVADVVGEDAVSAYEQAELDRQQRSQDIQEMMTSSATTSAGLGVLLSQWIKSNKEKNRLAKEAAERRQGQNAGNEAVDEAADESGGILANVKGIRTSLDKLVRLEKNADDISDGSWRFSFKDGTAIASVAVVVYNVLFYIIECFAEITLCLLTMFFPWTLVISLIGPWGKAYMEWAGRYIVVSFWKVIAVGINYITQMSMATVLKYEATEALRNLGVSSGTAGGSIAAGVTVSAIIAIAGVFALLHVNDLATAILPTGGGGGMGSMAAAGGGFAGSAAATPGKAATGIQGVVANHKGIASANAEKAFQQNVTSALGRLTGD